ncbi:cytochrome-c peroxidase [Sphingobium aquiterrae]|uniref:cytochrome-c peroxidase n=1 Tax=Sphingobium aquiterrae TaxID=2038656 RepID=UPI003018E86E
MPFEAGRKWLACSALVVAVSVFHASSAQPEIARTGTSDLRAQYAGPPESWPRPTLEAGAAFEEFGPLPAAATGLDPRRVALGRTLFEEPRLSRSGQIACATCHNPELGFGDGIKTSFGHDRQRGARNAQSLYAVAWMTPLFWDGRSPSLEDQAHFPITSPVEMASVSHRVERWINRQPDYRALFQPLQGHRRIGIADIGAAIAIYERTLRPPRSTWDRVFTEGTKLLSDQQLVGLHLFRTKAGCANCHNGPLLSDRRFHNLGISFYGRSLQDLGRYGVTHDPADVGYFRTPSLRGVRRTGPYMHNGIFPTLEGLVNLYAAGGGRDRTAQAQGTSAPPPRPDPLLHKRDISAEERKALVAFLEIL